MAAVNPVTQLRGITLRAGVEKGKNFVMRLKHEETYVLSVTAESIEHRAFRNEFCCIDNHIGPFDRRFRINRLS